VLFGLSVVGCFIIGPSIWGVVHSRWHVQAVLIFLRFFFDFFLFFKPSLSA
jgi:hypothetical protein